MADTAWDDTQVANTSIVNASKWNAMVSYVKAIASMVLGTGTPEMNGSGAAGNAATAAPFNHVHPSDTSRATTIHNLVDTTNHPVTGLTTGHFVKASSGTAYGFAAHGLTAADVAALSTASANAAKRTIFLSGAGGYAAKTTPDAGFTSGLEIGSAKIDVKGVNFNTNAAALSYHVWAVRMPTNYDGGNMTAKFRWTSDTAGAADDVRWQIQAMGVRDTDLIDHAYCAAVGVTDTVVAQYADHETSATGNIAPGGHPTAGNLMFFKVGRDFQNGDTSAANAILIGVTVIYTTTTYTDE